MAKNSIQVAIKVRPLLRKEKDLSLWRVVNNSIHLTDSQSEPYYFDHIFDQDASNQIIFDKTAKHIVHSAVEGFNGTIFAYGQTSSGKTYTMMGDEDNPGVMVLAAQEIFKQIVNTTDRQFLLRVGYIEIYNEKIYDLLNKKNQDLKIHETTTGVVSVNCDEICITCEEDLLNLLCTGNKERTVGETNMNERSSRSHAIFRIIIESREMDRSEDDAVIQSVLNLVDLAGSERANQTGARSTRLKEGGHINKSLLFLSNVIKRLSENEDDDKYISYRDSKLTRILQASLGGNALTSIICTIKPTAVEETQSTLSFAMRAKTIKNKPQVNEIVSDATMMKRLEGEIRQLKTCLAEERKKNESQIKVCQLEQRIKNEVLKIISSNSLHNIRTKSERRRRTWCPDSCSQQSVVQLSVHSGLSEALAGMEAQLNMPSRLVHPGRFLTPNIMLRDNAEVKSRPKIDVLIEKEEEQFVPPERCTVEELSSLKEGILHWDDCKSPTGNDLRQITLTPNVAAPAKQLETVERALLELEEFTNLEKVLDVRHDIVDALKQKLAAMAERNAILEEERLIYIGMKEELPIAKMALSDCQRRCDELQIQISRLTNHNRIANTKVEQYEEKLKLMTSQMEMENRAIVSLEFKLEQLKTKSNFRETELLDALADKEKDIINLNKSLCTVSQNNLEHSKENLLVLHSNLKRNTVADNGCIQCKDIDRLIVENKKLTLDFEQLTSEYTKLQLSNTQTTSALAASRLQELEHVQNMDPDDCEQLRTEVVAIRAKLDTVQQEYIQANSDRIARVEECGQLRNAVERARIELIRLHEKYDNLEAAWQEQQQTVINIQIEYDAILVKYKCLQIKYDELDASQSQEVCPRLQRENETLQLEINHLKTQVEKMNKTLQENYGFEIDSKVRAENLRCLREENKKLSSELIELRVQFEDLQKEYDTLSNQLMDSLQDGEILRGQCSKLEKQLDVLKLSSNKYEVQFAKQQPESEIDKKQSYHVTTDEDKISKSLSLHFDSVLDSIKNSGVSLENNGGRLRGVGRLKQLAEPLQKIELEQIMGKSRTFVSTTPASADSGVEFCKLLITSIDEVAQEHTNDVEVVMKGKVENQTFCINELGMIACNEKHELYQSTDNLKRRIIELSTKNEYLSNENKLIIDSTEKTIREMREQIEKLSSELFEKSLFVEQCSCSDYQKKIKCLEEQHIEMTALSAELEANAKVELMTGNLNCVAGTEIQLHELSDNSICESSINIKKYQIPDDSRIDELERIAADLSKKLSLKKVDLKESADRIEELQTECEDLKIRCATSEKLQNYMLVEPERKRSHIESKFDLSTSNMQQREKKCKEECNRLQLELCEQLELNECKSREHLRKYREWEKSEERYENAIGHLQRERDQLKAQSRVCNCAGVQIEHVIELNQQNAAPLKLEIYTQKESTSETEELNGFTGNNEVIKKNQDENLKKLRTCLEDEKSSLVEVNRFTLTAPQEAIEKHALIESELQSQRSAFLNIESELETKIDELYQKLSITSNVNDELASEKCRLEGLIGTLREERCNLRMQNENLMSEKSAYIEKIALHDKVQFELETQLRNVNDTVSKQEAELQDLRQHLKELTDVARQCNELNTNIKSLESNNRILCAEKDKITLKVSEITSDKNALEKQLLHLQERDTESTRQLSQLQEQLRSFGTLAQEKIELCMTIQTMKSEYEQTIASLLAEVSSLQLTLHDQKQEQIMNEERESSLLSKLENLSQDLHKAIANAESYKKLLCDYEEAEKSIIAAKQLAELQEALATSQSKEKQSAALVQFQLKQIDTLQKQGNVSQIQSVASGEFVQSLQNQIACWKKKMENEPSLHHQIQELESSFTELYVKYDTLVESNAHLSKTNADLKHKLISINLKSSDCEELRVNLQSLRNENSILHRRIEANTMDAGKNRLALNDLAQYKRFYEEHFEANKNDITLQGTKEANFKFEVDFATQKKKVDSSNLSFELNTSSSPYSRRSINEVSVETRSLKSVNVKDDGKLSLRQKTANTESQERRNRRLSTHDERRRQSIWGATRDVASMTDPSDSNCNCVELDGKLRECERNLFIRESQVTALNFKLKNHPLKAENSLLKKRLQGEQDKYTIELRKYKQMIRQQTANAGNLVLTTSNTMHALPKLSVNVETQTESDLDTCLQKLHGKYNDLKNICRHRYNIIKDLELKMSIQKVNENSTQIKTGDAGQVHMLKTQVDEAKKTVKLCQQKLEDDNVSFHS